MRNITGLAIFATLTAALASPAAAQRRGEIFLFSQPDFRGQRQVVSGANEDVRLGWVPGSVRVAPGDVWELCGRTRYRSPCQRVAENMANVGWAVRSARPSRVVPLPEPLPVPLPGPVPPPGGHQSLRGMSAEFFPAPSDRSGRIISCSSGGASCAAESANRFCRSRGWTASSFERQETVRGRNFLADVLCTRTRR